MPASCIQHGIRASRSEAWPGASGCARAPAGNVSTTCPPSAPPARAGPAASTCTGPLACSRSQPNATGAP